MDSKPDREFEGGQTADTDNRRDAVRKLGRFAAYAAPFTVLAFTKKANASTGSGGGPSPNPLGRHG